MLNSWKTKPIDFPLKRESSSSEREEMSLPFRKTFPLVGKSRAPMRFRNVDFPDPEGPIIDIKLPGEIPRLAFFKAVSSTFPN